MKFVHTADWQLGMKAAAIGSAGTAVRAARLDAGKRVVALAEAEGVDCLLVAGDLFEDNGVDRVLVQQCADLLGTFSGPVYLLPGNHDPYTPGSVWEHVAWQRHDNLHILDASTSCPLPGDATLYPCPLFDKYSRQDPTRAITVEDDGRIAIGLAHGTVEGSPDEDTEYFPIARDAAQRSGLDYLGLGHWHSTAYYPDATGAVRMAYAGAHEATKFGERDSGNVLLVEIAGRGATPTITPLRSGMLNWLAWSETLQQAGDLKQLRDRVAALEDPQHSLLDLRLEGLLPLSEESLLQEIRELAAGRFLFARIDEQRLTPAPDDDTWIQELPVGVMQECAIELQAKATQAAPHSEDAHLHTLALMQLYRLHQEGLAR